MKQRPGQKVKPDCNPQSLIVSQNNTSSWGPCAQTHEYVENSSPHSNANSKLLIIPWIRLDSFCCVPSPVCTCYHMAPSSTRLKWDLLLLCLSLPVPCPWEVWMSPKPQNQPSVLHVGCTACSLGVSQLIWHRVNGDFSLELSLVTLRDLRRLGMEIIWLS